MTDETIHAPPITPSPLVQFVSDHHPGARGLTYLNVTDICGYAHASRSANDEDRCDILLRSGQTVRVLGSSTEIKTTVEAMLKARQP